VDSGLSGTRRHRLMPSLNRGAQRVFKGRGKASNGKRVPPPKVAVEPVQLPPGREILIRQADPKMLEAVC